MAAKYPSDEYLRLEREFGCTSNVVSFRDKLRADEHQFHDEIDQVNYILGQDGGTAAANLLSFVSDESPLLNKLTTADATIKHSCG